MIQKKRINEKTLNVVRLDKLWEMPNSNIKNYKIREYNELIRKNPRAVYSAIASPYSQSDLIVIELSKLYGKQAVIYYTKKDTTKYADIDDVELVYLGGRLSITKNLAKKQFRTKYSNGYFVSAEGLDGDVFRSVSKDASEWEFLNDQNIHINVGSGMTALSIMHGFLKTNIKPKKIICYQTGMELLFDKYRGVTGLFNLKIVKLPWKYEDKIEYEDFNPIYDAKVLKYLTTNDFEDEDYFLNIGSV
jgi:hypothetical protein